MSNSALTVSHFDDGNEQPRRRIPRKLLPRDVRIEEQTPDLDLIEIDVPKKLLAIVANRPRYAFSDIRPAAFNHIILGRLLSSTKKLFRLSSPGGGLAYIKNGLPVGVTTAPQLAVILTDELVFEFINKKGEPARMPRERLQTVLDSEDFLSQFPLLDGVLSVPGYDADFNMHVPGYNDGGDGHRYFVVGEEGEVRHSTSALREFWELMPWATAADGVAALAGFLTTLLRTHFAGGRPMTCLTSTKSGGGKDTTLDFVAGRTQKVSLDWEPSDWAVVQNLADKRKANPLSGVFDIANVRLEGRRKYISSAGIEHVLTSPWPSIYSTGHGDPRPILNNFHLAMTTNDGWLSPDLFNRCLPIHLTPVGSMSDRASPLGPIKEEYLPKMLPVFEAEVRGMVEQWKKRKRPLDTNARHRFLPWARTIGGILLASDFEGFLSNYKLRQSQADPLRLALVRMAMHKPDEWADSEDWLAIASKLGLVKTVVPVQYQVGRVSQAEGLEITLYNHRDEKLIHQSLEGDIVELCLNYKTETLGDGFRRRQFRFGVVSCLEVSE